MADILDTLFDGNKPEKDQSEIPTESSLLKGCPTIQALMAWETFKGEPREKATLSCYVNEKTWGVRLVDNDNRRSFAIDGKSIGEACDSLETVLASGRVSWYYWPKTNGRQKTKKPAT